MLAREPTAAQALQLATSALRKAGIDTPRLDAEVLLAHILGVDRTRLLARLHQPLPPDAQDVFAHLVARRLHHEPVAYLVGHQEFYGLDFAVDHRVLIPRPETELLVERAIALANETSEVSETSEVCYGADVGTGCGCIAVALAVHLPEAQIYATDTSVHALEVARVNVQRHGLEERVHLLHGDLLSPVPPEIRLDIIVANLPYIPHAELETLPPSVREYEPLVIALDGGADGLELIRALLEVAPQRLRRDGTVLLEIGATQAPDVTKLAQVHFPEAAIRVLPDLAGRDRVVEIRTAG